MPRYRARREKRTGEGWELEGRRCWSPELRAGAWRLGQASADKVQGQTTAAAELRESAPQVDSCYFFLCPSRLPSGPSLSTFGDIMVVRRADREVWEYGGTAVERDGGRRKYVLLV